MPIAVQQQEATGEEKNRKVLTMTRMNEMKEFVDEWDANVDEIRQANNIRIAERKRKNDWEKGRAAAGVKKGSGHEGVDDRGRQGIRDGRRAIEQGEQAGKESLHDGDPRRQERKNKQQGNDEHSSDDGADVAPSPTAEHEAGSPGRERNEQCGIEPSMETDRHAQADEGPLPQEGAIGNGGPERPEARNEGGLHDRVPVPKMPERDESPEGGYRNAQDAPNSGHRPERNDASLLADYLFGRLFALANVDVSDIEAVNAECAITKAVNDTAKNLIDLADASTKAAMLRSNVTGRTEVPAFFLGEGDHDGD